MTGLIKPRLLCFEEDGSGLLNGWWLLPAGQDWSHGRFLLYQLLLLLDFSGGGGGRRSKGSRHKTIGEDEWRLAAAAGYAGKRGIS